MPPPPPPLAEPDDFDAFWRSTREELMDAPLDWRVESSHEKERLLVEEVTFRSSTGERAVAWITYPVDGEFTRGVVESHGYDGRSYGPDSNPHPPAGAARIYPCAPGLPRSYSATIPAAKAEHVLHGIRSRDTYVLRYCVADIWRAASVLSERFPHLEGGLDYVGVSFGGGIGALALPWDERFRRAHLHLPTFGHYPLRLSQPCSGSGEAVRRLVAREPQLRGVLAYFDAAIAATRIRIPVHVSAAQRDPSVPPGGQFAVYHALPGPKRLFVPSAGHMAYDEEVAETAARFRDVAEFFA